MDNKVCSICESIKNINNDPYFVKELETGYAVIGWHQRFKGYTVFICKVHATELHQLPHAYKMKHLEEMSLVAEAVYNLYKPQKMNYELLGNGVAHMHWHLFPRVDGDTLQKGPVWWLSKEELFDDRTRPGEDELKDMVVRLRAEIERLISKENVL